MRRAETASYVQRLRDVCRGPDVMGGSYVYSVCEMCRRPDVMGSSDGQDVWTCVWMHRRGLREGSAVDVDVWSLERVTGAVDGLVRGLCTMLSMVYGYGFLLFCS